MSSVLYLDCSSGASGDMLLGALIDLGLSLDELRAALGDLLPPGADLRAERVLRSGISAVAFTVIEPPQPDGPGHARHHHDHDPVHQHDHQHHHDEGHQHHPPQRHHHHRSLAALEELMGRAHLDAGVANRSRALYRRLAEVEAGIHQMPLDRIHLHEVGALDSVVDVVGVVWGLARLGVDRIVSSPLNVGSGCVDTEHGRLPVPAPATLRLLAGAPVYADGPAFEMVTPTGALLVTAYATEYGPLPAMRVERVGYGAGGRDVKGRPNVLRAILGRADFGGEHRRVVVLECNIDDMNPQIFGALMDRLLEAGALDAYYTPVQMKKGRPGTLVTVVAPPDRRDGITSLLFRETSTIGIRAVEMDRECLTRDMTTVETRFGQVRFKIARQGQTVMNAAPEFDDCLRLAAASGHPAKEVYAEAVRAYMNGRASADAAPGNTHGT